MVASGFDGHRRRAPPKCAGLNIDPDVFPFASISIRSFPCFKHPKIAAREGRAKVTQKTPVGISSVAVNTTVLSVTFDQAVILKGVPQYTTDIAGATPASATMSSPTTLELTFSATIAAATEVKIPFEDPGIRSAVGGFVADSTFPV